MNSGRAKLRRAMLGAYWLAMAVGSHWPRLDVGDNDALPLGVDKWLHIGAYAGLIMLLIGAGFFGARSSRRNVLLSIAVVLLYSIVDELTQHFSPGRTVAPGDWFASVTGVALGLVTWRGWRWVMAWVDGEAAATSGEKSEPAVVDNGSTDGGFVANTRVVSLLTLFSRFFGLGRDWTLAWVFGFSAVMDAFVIAFMIPNLFRRLFGEGALAAAFIPHYTRLHAHDQAASRRFAGYITCLLAAGLTALTLAGVVILTGLLTGGVVGETWRLTAELTRVTLWYTPMVCLVAILGAMLQVHHRFGAPAAAPVVLNVFIMVSATGAWAAGMGQIAAMYAVCVSVLAAGVVQVAWQWALLHRAAGPLQWWRPEDLKRGAAVDEARRKLLLQWGPTIIGLAVLQINTLADMLIARGFSGEPGQMMNLFGRSVEYPMQVGAAAVLGATARLYEFPLGVFGIAVATAIFPALSAAAEQPDRFTHLLRQGLRLTIYIGLPASIGLMLVRDPLSKAIYGEAGALKPGDAERIAVVLCGYGPAVWAYSMNHLLTRAFYAHHNTLTPMRVSVSIVALNVVLNLLLIWPLGTAGLAWSTSICAMLQCAVLLVLVRRYVPMPVDAAVRASWGRTAGLTAAMSLAVWLLVESVYDPSLGRTAVAMILLASVSLGAAIVVAVSRIMRIDELRWLLRRTTPG